MLDLIPMPSHQKSLVGKLNDAAGYCVYCTLYCVQLFPEFPSDGDSLYFALAVSNTRDVVWIVIKSSPS